MRADTWSPAATPMLRGRGGMLLRASGRGAFQLRERKRTLERTAGARRGLRPAHSVLVFIWVAMCVSCSPCCTHFSVCCSAKHLTIREASGLSACALRHTTGACVDDDVRCGR